MVVVAIIGILLLIGIPSIMKARIMAQETMIKNNMRVIRDTVEQLAFETMKDPKDIPLDDIFSAIGSAPAGKPSYYCMPWPTGIFLLDVNSHLFPAVIVYWTGNYTWYSNDNILGGSFQQMFENYD